MNIYLAGTMPGRVKRDMNLYLAESGGLLEAYIPEKLFDGANILQSFYYADDFTSKVIIPNCKRFMLDSGAYSFMAGKKSVNWNEYVEKYCQFIRANNVQHYFELDIDSIIGFEQVLEIRKTLEQKTGVKPIPVWHRSRGYNSFLKDAESFPYIAIGGIVTKEIAQKDYPIFSKLIKDAHDRNAKIHGLGFTNLRGITQYHFDSVDSTAWVSGNRFGAIYRFDGTTMKKIGKPEGCRVKSSKAAINNFLEWKKFAQYAEAKL